MIPTGVLGEQVLVRAWIPLDDTHTMFWSMSAPQTRRRGTGGTRSQQNGQVVTGTGSQPAYLPNTSDWLGLSARGMTPPGVDDPELYRIRSGGVILPRTADWQEATQALRQAFVHHPDSSR